MTTNDRHGTEPLSKGSFEVRTDTVHDVLANKHRRYAIDCLQKYDEPLTLADLANEVSARENGTRVTDIPAEEMKDVYMELYHVHVPKMEEAGIVAYDQDRDLVTLTENADQLTPYLNLHSKE